MQKSLYLINVASQRAPHPAPQRLQHGQVEVAGLLGAVGVVSLGAGSQPKFRVLKVLTPKFKLRSFDSKVLTPKF